MPETAWIIVLWLLAFGGAVGSFLNVVVYRLPLGLSLIHPPSHCPKCGKAIRWFDNVPVFGWIVLRGRCRQCHNPISARYPIVEAVTAALFAAVAIVEMPYLCKTEMYGLYPYHLLLLCTLLCAGLIEYDGNRPPVKLFVPALIVGIVAPCIWPALRPWPACGVLSPTWLAGTVDGLAGLAAGALFSGIAWRTLRSQKPIGLVLSLICMSLFLGWEAAGMITIVTAVLVAAFWLPVPVVSRAPTLCLGAVTILWILTLCWYSIWPQLYCL